MILTFAGHDLAWVFFLAKLPVFSLAEEGESQSACLSWLPEDSYLTAGCLLARLLSWYFVVVSLPSSPHKYSDGAMQPT